MLVFAHSAEAQAFFDRIPTKKKRDCPVELYESVQEEAQIDFLITGEGHYNASESISVYCSMQIGNILRVINLGVCGAVQKDVVYRGSVFSIRTSYAYGVNEPEYESYSLLNPDEQGIDCISSLVRVLDVDLAEQLGYVAPLVDRELWYVARVCKNYQIPMRSYKCVLDIPIDGEKISQQQIFKAIPDHSESLYQFYKKDSVKDCEEQKANWVDLLGMNFYVTFAQAKELEKLGKMYKAKFLKEPTDLVKSVELQNFSAKARTRELLHQFAKLLDPQQYVRDQQWEKVQLYFQQQKISIGTQAKREPVSYEYRFSATSADEYYKAVSFLQKESFPPVD